MFCKISYEDNTIEYKNKRKITDTNRKRVAFVVEKFTEVSIGGETAISLNLVDFLLNNGYCVDIYCNDIGEEQVNSFSHNIFPDFYRYEKEYVNEICSDKYGIVIGSRFALKFPDIHADIYTIHSHSDLYSQKTKLGFMYKFFKSKCKRIENEIMNLKLNKNSKFVFCSEQLAQDYTSLVKLDDFVVLNPYPNWVPNEGYVKSQKDIFTFGISATGFQNKGGYLLLKSAFLLKLTGKIFKLKIIYKKNGGILQNIFITLLGLKNNIEFIPKQNNMNNFYENIDCLVQPSLLESFGMVAMEAMNFDLPVIVSSTSGVKTLVINGQNGFIFDYSKNKTWNLFRCLQQVMSSDFLENFSSIEKVKFGDKEGYNKEFFAIISSVLN